MKRHLSAIALAAGMLLAGALLAFYLHQEVKGQVLSQFNESQLLIARQAAGDIESYFDARSQDVRHLSSLTSLQHLDAKTMPADIQATFTRLKTAYVKDVVVLDATGKVVYSTAGDAIGSDNAGSDIDAWAKEPVNKGTVRLVLEKSEKQVTSATGEGLRLPSPRFFLVTPLYQEPGAGGAFTGMLLLSVDLEMLAEGSLGLTPTKSLRQLRIWAMDENGTLLLQSEHPEMVLRSIRGTSAACNRCHVSFDYAEKMLTAKQGTLEYQLQGRPSKIAAFAPMTFEGVSWIVVVNAPRDDITGFIRTNTIETLGLFGVVGVVVGFTFFSAYRSSAEANYRAIFDTANDAIFVHDAATSAIVDVNRKMSEMYGYTRDEALHLTVRDLSAGVAPHTQEPALEAMREAAAGTPQLFEWLAKDRAGRLFWVEVNLRRVIIGGHDRLLAIVRDITERKRAERQIRESHESQKTLNALLRLGLEDMTLKELLHHALTLVLHNTWPVTLGVGAVFLVDEHAGDLVLEADNGIDRHILERCARVPLGCCLCGRVASSGQALYCGGIDERHETTFVGMSPHGHYCIPIAAGEKMLGVLNVYLEAGHARDTAELEFLGAFASTLAGIIVRKRAEQSLRAADEQLREQATLVQLGEMAAVVAHEVKNPLAGVRGAIQVIGTRLPARGKDAVVVDEVIARLDALDELMKDLLLFARPPGARLVPVDLVALAEQTSALVGQAPAERDLRFAIDGSAPEVMADPKLLQIVLLNLLLNAAHAMQSKGTIRISVAASGESCRIAIADTGPGIPPEIRDRIFKPFFTTKSRGTGLGLSTAKRLVESQHGCISVECPVEGGTVVTIELPRGQQAGKARG